MAAKSVLNINEEQLAFYWAIGLTITQWAHVEHALFQVVYRAFGNSENRGLAGGFFSIENFRSKLAFVDRVAAASKEFEPFYAEWAKLRDDVRALSSRRNELAHSQVMVFLSAPEGRRYAIVPLFGPKPSKKHNPQHPPPGSICVRDIDLTRLRFSKAFVRLTSLCCRIDGHEDLFAEHAQQEPKAQSLGELKRQIHAMSGQPAQSSDE